MTRHDDNARLRHMLDYGREAIELAAGRQRRDLDIDRTFRYAMTHLVEIVGEAAAHVSQPYCAAHPQVPWGTIVGVRNRLIHGYSEVDLDILWDIVQIDLPPLIAELGKIVAMD